MEKQQNPVLFYLGRAGFWLIVAIVVIFTMFPFYWAVNTSLKTEGQVVLPTDYIHTDPTIANYQNVLSSDSFLRALRNSAIVSSVTVLLALIVGSFAAYALGRVNFRGKTIMLYLVLAMTMFPQISILSGLFAIVRDLDLFGNLLSLVVTYPIFTLPFTVWVLTSFFRGLPGEIEQAALVDGATPFQTFYLILLPLTAPALVTTGLLAFVAAWNEYLFALTFTLPNDKAHPVTVAIALFTGTVSRQEPIAEVMAATVIVTIPLIVLVLIFQRRIVEGLTAGAVKG
ncbi:MAG: carbohydrate ABC transporter permease [Anaerolineae bacterium]|nr:carbohydrate ABC transporter permease [Anaerolineae bacterium]